MLSKKLLLVCVSCLALTACSVDEIASVNKQISDGAFALTGALRGNSSSADSNGMPVLSLAQKPATKSRTQEYSVPVDVDTAAARLNVITSLYLSMKLKRSAKKTPVGNGRHQQYLNRTQYGRLCPVVIIKWVKTGTIMII
ncbi:Uncharacterised protein [Escherichia coli]|nr:Uncharacterised protein [Escherichia coli]